MKSRHNLTLILLVAFSLLFTSCDDLSNIPKGKLIKSYDSPNKNYTINIYLCDGGATTDFAIRGELVDNFNTFNTKNIYWCYHEEDANVVWIDEENVIINGRKLNVLNDVYGFRDDNANTKRFIVFRCGMVLY